MATSILRVGRLTSLKCLQLEKWGILRIPSFCTQVGEPMKPAEKAKTQVIEAPDGRASLLAYKTVVGFPVKLFSSGILQTPALSEIELLTSPAAFETVVDTAAPAIAKATSAVVEEQVTTEESLECAASPVVDVAPPVAAVEDPVTLSESVTVSTTTPVADKATTSALETDTEAPTLVVETVANQESSASAAPVMKSVPAFEALSIAEPVSLEVTARELVAIEETGTELSVTQLAMVSEGATVSDISTHVDAAPVVAEALHEDILVVTSSTAAKVVIAAPSSEPGAAPVDGSSSSSSDSDSDDEKSDEEKSEVKRNGKSKDADLAEQKVKDHANETGPISVIPAETILLAMHVVTPPVTTVVDYRVVQAQAALELTAVKEAPTGFPETLPKPSLDVAGNGTLTGCSEELIEAVQEIAADPIELMAEAAPDVAVTTIERITAAVHIVNTGAEDASESVPAEGLGEVKSVAEAPVVVISVAALPESAAEAISDEPAAKTIPFEAADKVTAEAAPAAEANTENECDAPPLESTEGLIDPAPVGAEAAGEELQTEAQEEPEPVEASEEAATAPPQVEPEPFDISTYKNYQHHSYNPYTFADLDLEMFQYRLPQPSSGRPSPRH